MKCKAQLYVAGLISYATTGKLFFGVF